MGGQRTLKLLAVALVVVLFFSGIGLGYVVGYSRALVSEQAKWTGGDWGKLNQVLYHIDNNFIFEYDRKVLEDGALRGLMDSLGDPYSSYLTAKEIEDMQIRMGAAYGGIGVQVTEVNKRVVILDVFPDSPAEAAGLIPGDQIVEVDGLDIQGMILDQAVSYVRGEPGTVVTLGIIREGRQEVLQVNVTRADIPPRPSVTHENLGNGIGYTRISQFGINTAAEFSESLRELKGQGMKGLIVDLRGNPGGRVSAVYEIARQLVPQGLIFYYVDKDGKKTNEYFSNLRSRDFEVVVLIDERSASASEILAGALKDTDGATLVGKKSFGKGIVQGSFDVGTSGDAIMLTMAWYYTPSGTMIHGNGIQPHHDVEANEAILLPRLSYAGLLELGSDDLRVELLQRMLQALDYDVQVTGVFDQATQTAVSAFQRSNGLTVTGRVNQNTTDRLNQRWEVFKREADAQLSKALEVIRQKTN